MTQTAKRYAAKLAELEHDPDFVLDRVKVELAEQIYLAMTGKGVTQAELARLLDRKASYVSRLLAGTENVTTATLVRVAMALGCDLHINITPGKTQRFETHDWEEATRVRRVPSLFRSHADMRPLRTAVVAPTRSAA
jgi:transcriptional regulator with XRE-family HTH domain